MQIIDNINGNHNQSILAMLPSADEILLVSPFLTEDFDGFIQDIAGLGVKRISLITTLKDNTPDLFKKANSFTALTEACSFNNIEYEVRIDNALHGKMYIALKDNVPFRGIITSANFTVKGLTNNHEWGIEFADVSKLQCVVNDLNQVSSFPLSQTELESIINAIKTYQRENPLATEHKPNLNVTNFINRRNRVIQGDIQYFIKPVGSKENPFTVNRKLKREIQEMHFSKRPRAVRPGDILICYGVGPKKIIGYFKVLNQPYESNDYVRWPWKVETENLCPAYSDRWHIFGNTLASIKATYGNEKILTNAGGKTLGALSRGADKIQLNPDFAKHIINIIENSI